MIFSSLLVCSNELHISGSCRLVTEVIIPLKVLSVWHTVWAGLWRSGRGSAWSWEFSWGQAMTSLFERLDEEEAIARGELSALRDKVAQTEERLARLAALEKEEPTARISCSMSAMMAAESLYIQAEQAAHRTRDPDLTAMIARTPRPEAP
ncbi:hypothetical protein [Streptomyces sp. NPDC059788]|uniref:hypothetical protein n=1 Tax=Streptomyces sp. NPDC059788 TaxID=3346948 RepID=UPI0036538A5F